MYICICNAIRECELRACARRIQGDARACYTAMGKPPQCGQCLDDADEIIRDEHEAAFKPAIAA